jgi:hypothetical protein
MTEVDSALVQKMAKGELANYGTADQFCLQLKSKVYIPLRLQSVGTLLILMPIPTLTLISHTHCYAYPHSLVCILFLQLQSLGKENA